MNINTEYNKEDKAKILIVDDELLVAADIKRIIEKAGHIVIGSAVDAEEAISFVKTGKPDLVLMDIKLKKGIDGISAAEIIQTIDEIPIIFLSAFSDQNTFERAKKIGPFGYLIKPFNSRELAIAIETSLYKHSLEKRLKENEKRFRLFYEDSPLPYHSLDINGNVLEINNPWQELLGYFREEVVGHHISEFLSGSSIDKLSSSLKILLSSGELKNAEFEFIHKNGSSLIISVNGKISKNTEGAFLQSHFVLHNITQQKLTETALRESENKMQSIFRTAPIGIGIISERIILYVNDEISRMTGYKPNDLLGKDIKILCPDEIDCIRVGKELMNQISSSGTGRIETSWIRKNGSTIDIIFSKTPIDIKRPEKEMVFTALDITERRDAEKELKQSESKFRSYIEYSPLGIFILNEFGKFTGVNNAAVKMLGYSYSELVQLTLPDILPDESINEGWIHFNRLKKTGFVEVEIFLRRKDNIKIWTMSSAVKLAENRFIFYAQDISERKRTEEALKLSEEKYRYLFNANLDAILIYPIVNDKMGCFIEANEAASRLLGYSKSELYNITAPELETEFCQEEFLRRKNAIRSSGNVTFETRIKTKSGNIIEVDISAYVIQYKGIPVVMSLIRDITEKKKSELAIKEREAKFSAFMDNLQGTAYIKDSSSRYIFLNKNAIDLLKINLNDWLGKTDKELNFFPDNVIKEVELHDQEVLNKNISLNTIEHIPINNEMHYWKTIKFPLHIENSASPLIAGVGIDVTSEKRLEMAMNTVISLNHELDELTIDDILSRCLEACESSTNSKISFLHFINNNDGQIDLQIWSSNTLKICNVDKMELHYSIEKAGIWVDCAVKGEPVIANDYHSIKHKKGLPQGHVNVIRMLTVPIFEDDRVVAIVGVGNKEVNYEEIDVKLVEIISNNVWKIIRRKKTEEVLKNSLKEKETLLRELYHRTKNNMQVISSILFLQTENSNNSDLNQILYEVSNRINAMSLVHHKLYQSKNLSMINLKEYIIDLLNLLMSSYSISRDKVIIKHDLSDVYVLIDYAIPCGLIINEIISNTFKYAFPGDCIGELSIKLFRNESNEIVFISQDNGIGIPENLDIQNPKTLGMKLIHNITQHQLNGIVSVINKNGVGITISFKDNQYNTRV